MPTVGVHPAGDPGGHLRGGHPRRGPPGPHQPVPDQLLLGTRPHVQRRVGA